MRCVPLLREIRESLRPLARYPSVSVVVPVRNEEANVVGAALGSILDQDYPGRLEVVAVDDRSTDRTEEVLARLASERSDV